MKNVDEKKFSSSLKSNKHKNKETCKAVVFFTPLLIVILCFGIVILFGLRFFITAQSYTNLLFNEKSEAENMAEDNQYKRSDAIPMVGKTKSEKDDTKEHKIIYPYYGDLYAHLTISNDSVKVKNSPIYWGDSDDLLDKGIVQSNYSAYIGTTGRVVLAAHNHTYFRYLPNIKVGDKVTLKTDYGTFTYKVKQTKVLKDTDTSLLYYDPTAENVTDDLILYTCWNNGYMGLSNERLYVICSVVKKQYKD